MKKKNNEIVLNRPNGHLSVTIKNIIWDYDEGEEGECPTELNGLTFDCFHFNPIGEINDKKHTITFTESELEDWLSDWLSNCYGFCHCGFEFTYKIFKGKRVANSKDGMKKYRVREIVNVTRIYEVEAKDKDEAYDLVMNGNEEPVKVDEDHSETIIDEIKEN